MDLPAGILYAHTFKKLPNSAPKIKAKKRETVELCVKRIKDKLFKNCSEFMINKKATVLSVAKKI